MRMRGAATLVALLVSCLIASAASASIPRFAVYPESRSAEAKYLLVEVLQDDLVHFQASTSHADRPADFEAKGIYLSQMVERREFEGPRRFEREETDLLTIVRTEAIRLEINKQDVSVAVYDIAQQPEVLLTVHSYGDDGQWTYLKMKSDWATDIYGLGERYVEPYGNLNYNFMGKEWRLASNEFGASHWQLMVDDVPKGMSALASFPIMYALGPDMLNYATFVDDVRAKEWFFNTKPFVCRMKSDEIRWMTFTGNSLRDLRAKYMDLVGHAPVIPRKAMGMWQSLFGYRNWTHLADEIKLLMAPENHALRFPLDGVVFDLYWFGGSFYSGSFEEATHSQMGSIHWDLKNFPRPAEHLKQLKEKMGLGSVVIEESYVAQKAKGYDRLAKEGYLVRDCETCGPVTLGDASVDERWWGAGSMIDWSNTDGANFWFDCKNCPLLAGCKVDKAKCHGMLQETDALTLRRATEEEHPEVTGFWLDLGEPEIYRRHSYYHGYEEADGQVKHSHADYHNVHMLYWAESTYKGFERNKGIKQRPFLLCRTGTSGIQRYGAAMWSGDIFPDIRNMGSSLGIQTHMSLSGIDYFGSDIGGFQRWQEGDAERAVDNERFTLWFANSAWFDTPVRPHAWQPTGREDIQSSPVKIGDLLSNLYNTRLRYSLSPYYYSLSYNAYLNAEAVVPPLVYYFQKDATVRAMGDEKMVGPFLLVGAHATLGSTSRRIYLPAGTWIDYHSHRRYQGPIWLDDVPVTQPAFGKQVVSLPVYARDGAILPMLHVDQLTKNVMGERWAPVSEEEKAMYMVGTQMLAALNLQVFLPSPSEVGVTGERPFTSFSIFEDDGESISYRNGEFRQTKITTHTVDNGAIVYVHPAEGHYPGAVTERRVMLTAILDREQGRAVSDVRVNGVALPLCDSMAQLYATDACYVFIEESEAIKLVVKTTPANVYDRLFIQIGSGASAVNTMFA